MAAANSRLVEFIIMGERMPAASNPHCRAAAITLKKPHTATAAYSRIIGAVLGTIMAIIITHHMLTMMPAYSRFHRAGVAITDIASPMVPDI
jgi:hypothetical protein